MVDRDVPPQGLLPEYISPPTIEGLPEGFSLKEHILKCRSADDLYLDREDEGDTTHLVQRIPGLLTTALEAGSWRDAYELQRLGEEWGQAIDADLQQGLGKILLEWGAAGFERAFPEGVQSERGVRARSIMDFFGFAQGHVRRYDITEEWATDALSRLGDTIFSYILQAPGKAYGEFVVFQYNNWQQPRGRQVPKLVGALAAIQDQESLLPRLQTAADNLRAEGPERALEVMVMGMESGVAGSTEVGAEFETGINAIDVGRVVRNQKDQRRGIIEVGEDPYWLRADPKSMAELVEYIVPGAHERAEEVVGRRRIEVIETSLDEIRGHSGEWEELSSTIRTAATLGVAPDARAVARLVDLCALRGPEEELGEQPASERFARLLELGRNGQIEYETLFGALVDIGDQYAKFQKQHESNDSLSLGDLNDVFPYDYIDVNYENLRKLYYYLLMLPRIFTKEFESNPGVAAHSLDYFVDQQQVLGMIATYIKHEVDPARRHITPERKRLVTTYSGDEFKGPVNSDLPMKVRHPERGPRSMIYRYPLEYTAKDIIMSSLKQAVEANRVATLIDWEQRANAGEIVAYWP